MDCELAGQEVEILMKNCHLPSFDSTRRDGAMGQLSHHQVDHLNHLGCVIQGQESSLNSGDHLERLSVRLKSSPLSVCNDSESLISTSLTCTCVDWSPDRLDCGRAGSQTNFMTSCCGANDKFLELNKLKINRGTETCSARNNLHEYKTNDSIELVPVLCSKQRNVSSEILTRKLCTSDNCCISRSIENGANVTSCIEHTGSDSNICRNSCIFSKIIVNNNDMQSTGIDCLPSVKRSKITNRELTEQGSYCFRSESSFSQETSRNDQISDFTAKPDTMLTGSKNFSCLTVTQFCDIVRKNKIPTFQQFRNIGRCMFYVAVLFLYLSLCLGSTAYAQGTPEPCQNTSCVECMRYETYEYQCNCMDNETQVTACSSNDAGVCDTTSCIEERQQHNYSSCAETNTSRVSCLCVPGSSCNVSLGPCENVTCLNNGTCEINGSSYVCQCLPGFTGEHCETNMLGCEILKPCLKNATCTDIADGYNCSCAEGYTGTNCSTASCAGINCNYGSCQIVADQWKCVCPPHVEGIYCQLSNFCASSPCGVNGNCTENGTSYVCLCHDGFTGENCTESVSACASNPCENNGTCSPVPNGFTCQCLPGYTGTTCATPIINHCSSNPCENNGTCTSNTDGYKCNCETGYTGLNCSTSLDACASEPCQNGTCVDIGGGAYSCSCHAGFTGPNCSSIIDTCQSNSCSNGGTCQPIVGGYKCTCAAGFTGPNCNTPISPCQPNPCLSGGTCTPQAGGFSCSCLPGFTGSTCATDINECVSNPCRNGGTCSNQVNSFSCQCSGDYTGTTCESCNAAVACSDRGNCSIATNGTICVCMAGYSGPTCASKTSDSSDTPVGLIVGLTVGLFALLVIIILVITLAVCMRKKRATAGTYRPSQQEMKGSRVDFGNVLKKPPEERLI